MRIESGRGYSAMDESGEEDLFADNVDEYEDDPPLLPPPVIPTASGAARTIATDDVPGTQGNQTPPP